MLFRMHSILSNLLLTNRVPLHLPGRTDESVSIVFGQIRVAHVRQLLTLGVEIDGDDNDDEENEDSTAEMKEITLCTATLTCDPPNSVLTEFDALEPRIGELSDQLTKNLSSAQLLARMSGTTVQRFETPPRVHMGAHFGSYASETENILRNETRRAIRLLSWRLGMLSYHEPSHRRRFECSSDGIIWRTLRKYGQ